MGCVNLSAPIRASSVRRGTLRITVKGKLSYICNATPGAAELNYHHGRAPLRGLGNESLRCLVLPITGCVEKDDGLFRAEPLGLSDRIELIERYVTVSADVSQTSVVILDEVGHLGIAQTVSHAAVGVDLEFRHSPRPSNTRGRLSRWYVPVGQAIWGSNPSGMV
jgi:hypothetical protein